MHGINQAIHKLQPIKIKYECMQHSKITHIQQLVPTQFPRQKIKI